jgi:hypothetical protein
MILYYLEKRQKFKAFYEASGAGGDKNKNLKEQECETESGAGM